MSKKNEVLKQSAEDAINALWCDTSVSKQSAIENMKEMISVCKNNIQATEQDIRNEEKERG